MGGVGSHIRRRFRFVVEGDTEIYLERIDGAVERVLFRLPPSDGTRPSSFDEVQISPNRKHLLIPCHTGGWDVLANRRLFIADIETGATIEVAVSQELFELDIGSNSSLCNWLADGSFVVSLTYHPEDAPHQFQRTFLRYTLADMDSPTTLDLGGHRSSLLLTADGYKWYVEISRDDCRVLEGERPRPPTTDEMAEYKRLWAEEYASSKSIGSHVVTVMSRPAPARGLFAWSEGEDPWSQDIYLDGRWVRRTEGDIQNMMFSGEDLLWSDTAKLFFWCEERPPGEPFSLTTYAMDGDGHYRGLFRGRFLAILPAD